MKKTQPDTAAAAVTIVRCAVYTRKSTEEGLNQEFNSLDAQRESAEAYIASQRAEGWVCLPERFDDGGCTGANLDRPALQRLLAAIAAGQVDCVVVYQVDRFSRSLLDFARLMEAFEKHSVADPERAVVVRPVRARADRRAYARQGGGHASQGEVVRRQAALGLRRRSRQSPA